MAKIKRNNLEEAVHLAESNGMTYAQFQQLETLGKAKIVNGKMFLTREALRLLGRDSYEHN